MVSSNQNTSFKKKKDSKTPIYRLIMKVCLLPYLLLILSLVISIKAGLRFNKSPSIALGIYQTTGLPVTKNNYINICVKPSVLLDVAFKHNYLSTNLLCPNFEPSMMKRIAAITGDTVTIKHDGVWINNQLEPNSKPILQFNEFDNSQFINYQLKENEALLMSDNQKYGFDGRYYGVINLVKDVSKIEVIEPVWTYTRLIK